MAKFDELNLCFNHNLCQALADFCYQHANRLVRNVDSFLKEFNYHVTLNHIDTFIFDN
jgi:hypothetical protein